MKMIAPLCQKQVDFLKNSSSCWLNVAEGGKRAGKNVLQDLIFCTELETHPDKIHLVAGVSMATAKLNILECDGYGIYNYFENRYRTGKYGNRDCVYLSTKTGTKVLLISGGGKKGSDKYIKGNTYGMVYITEVNECDPDFIQEALDRTTSSHRRKVFFDLNPKNPNHNFYDTILNFHMKEQAINSNYGLNYAHFTIADNLSISNERLRNVLKTYDKNSIWYKRDILGLRVAPEGIIYSYFIEHEKEILMDEINHSLIQRIVVGVDFGGHNSRHAFVATAIMKDLKVIVIKSERMEAEGSSPIDLEKKFVEFVRSLNDEFAKPVEVRYDSAEQVLKNGLDMAILHNGLRASGYNAMKRPIVDRIRGTIRLMQSGRLHLLKNRNNTLSNAFKNALWDVKSTDDVRLDDGSSDIDSLDAFEYTIEPLLLQLNQRGKEI